MSNTFSVGPITFEFKNNELFVRKGLSCESIKVSNKYWSRDSWLALEDFFKGESHEFAINFVNYSFIFEGGISPHLVSYSRDLAERKMQIDGTRVTREQIATLPFKLVKDIIAGKTVMVTEVVKTTVLNCGGVTMMSDDNFLVLPMGMQSQVNRYMIVAAGLVPYTMNENTFFNVSEKQYTIKNDTLFEIVYK